MECVHNQKYGTRTDGSDRDPTFLFLRRRVPLRQRVGIVENQCRRFKTSVMLAEIAKALGFVPFESHKTQRRAYDDASRVCCQYKRTYNMSQRDARGLIRMAERVGFEPTSPVLPGYPLSRRALSTAQTPLRGRSVNKLNKRVARSQPCEHAPCREPQDSAMIRRARLQGPAPQGRDFSSADFSAPASGPSTPESP